MRAWNRNRRDLHYIKPGDYKALLKVVPTLRWKVFYSLAYTTAARFGELFNLTERDIDFGRGKLLIRSREGTSDVRPFHVKDHEDREMPLPTYTMKLLAGCLKMRPNGSPLILVTPERSKLDGELTVHAFRKSCGQDWANHLPMNVVKELMGHADIQTSAEFYSTVSDEHEVMVQWVTEALIKAIRRRRQTLKRRFAPKPARIERSADD